MAAEEDVKDGYKKMESGGLHIFLDSNSLRTYLQTTECRRDCNRSKRAANRINFKNLG